MEGSPAKQRKKTKRPNFKIQGVAVAMSGAFVWIRWFTPWEGWGAFIFALYAVLVASWFVAPIGLTLGHLLPSFVAGSSSSRAWVVGVFFGVCAATVASFFTNFLLGGSTNYSHLPSMMVLFAAWVGLWAIRVARTADVSERNKIAKGFREWLAIGKES